MLVSFCVLTRAQAQWLTKADERPEHRPISRIILPEEQEHAGIANALKWYWGQRTFGLGYIPKNALQIAVQKRDAMRAEGKGMEALAAQPQWSLVGPSNAGGRVEAVAIHPTDPKTVYIGAANGGVWKTTDGGNSWTPLTDNMQSLAMGALAIDPQHPDTVYAGTGEYPSTNDSYSGYGLLRTTDGGDTWSSIGPSSVAAYSRIIVNPKHSNIIYAAAGRSGGGVLRSTDGGKTWPWLQGGLPQNVSVSDLALSMNGDTAVLYAGVVGNGVWRSTDGGNTWTKLSGLPWQPSDYVRISLDVDPTDWQNVVVLDVNGFAAAGQDDFGGVEVSNDGGSIWNDAGDESSLQPFFEGGATPPQGWYDAYIRVDPSNFNHMLLGGVPFWSTIDGGASWTENRYIHVDHHDAEFAPSDPSQVYIGCDGGVYYSSDGGSDFNTSQFNIPISEFYVIGVDQLQSDMTYGGLQDNGLVSGPSSSDWGTFDPYAGDGAYAVPDPKHEGVIYCNATEGMPQRDDNGTVSDMGVYSGSDYVNWLNPIHVDPKNDILYFGTDHLYINNNPATSDSWIRCSTKLALSTDSSSSIQAIDAFGDKETIICGTSAGHVFLTTNNGARWSYVSNGLPGRWVTCVKFDPSSKSTFYATLSGYGAGHVFKTTNNGTTWTNISSTLPDIPVNALEMDPANASVLYIGTDVGVFFSPNDGGLWVPYGTGLPNVAIDFMDVQVYDRKLYVGTHGRSVWSIPLVDDVTGISLPAQRTTWTIGDSASVVWHGFASPVTLDLSLNGGGSWQNIASGVSGTSYSISDVMYPQSDNVLVRVADGTNTVVSPLFSVVQQKRGNQLAVVSELPFYLYDIAYDKDDNVLWATTYDQSENLYKIDPDRGTLLDSVKLNLQSASQMAGLTGIKYDPSSKHLFLQQVLNTSDPYAWSSNMYEVTTAGAIVRWAPSPAEYGTGIYIKGDSLLVADRMTQQIQISRLEDWTNFGVYNPLNFSDTRDAIYGSRGLTYDPKLGEYLLAYTEFDGSNRQSTTFNGSDLLFLDTVSGAEQSSVAIMDGETEANVRGLEYDPRGAGNTAWMTILNSSGSSKIVKIALTDGPSGTAAPSYTTQPSTIDCGGVDTGSSRPLSVEIHNVGNAAGMLKLISISPVVTDYSLSSLTYPITLNPGDSLGITITFAPHTAGRKNATLVLTASLDNSQITFPITGVATINGAGVTETTNPGGWSLELSPNPARDYVDLTVTAGRSDFAQAHLYDVTGRELRTIPLGTLVNGEQQLELSTANLPNGIYFVRVTGTNGEVCGGRLAIER